MRLKKKTTCGSGEGQKPGGDNPSGGNTGDNGNQGDSGNNSGNSGSTNNNGNTGSSGSNKPSTGTTSGSNSNRKPSGGSNNNNNSNNGNTQNNNENGENNENQNEETNTIGNTIDGNIDNTVENSTVQNIFDKEENIINTDELKFKKQENKKQHGDHGKGCRINDDKPVTAHPGNRMIHPGERENGHQIPFTPGQAGAVQMAARSSDIQNHRVIFIRIHRSGKPFDTILRFLFLPVKNPVKPLKIIIVFIVLIRYDAASVFSYDIGINQRTVFVEKKNLTHIF